MKVNRDLVKQFRIEKFWTPEKLAAKSGIHARTIQRNEGNGTASMQPCIAIGLAL